MERQTKAVEDTVQSANDTIELIIKKESATLDFELSDIEWKDAPITPFNS